MRTGCLGAVVGLVAGHYVVHFTLRWTGKLGVGCMSGFSALGYFHWYLLGMFLGACAGTMLFAAARHFRWADLSDRKQRRRKKRRTKDLPTIDEHGPF